MEGRGRLFVLSRILLEAVIDQRGRIARCHSNRNQTAKTPHCNHLPQLSSLWRSLSYTWQSILHSLRLPALHMIDLEPLDLVIRLCIYLPSVPPETKIMPLIQFLLVFSKQRSLVSRAYTSL